MTRKEMVGKLSESIGVDKKTVASLIDLLQGEILQILYDDGKFVQNGFGSFCAAVSSEHTGRNLQTGKKMIYPKKRKLKFKASNALKKRLNAGGANE